VNHQDTKTRLLAAAENLFAMKGFRGISVREITDLAGANLAAVNYHFGSKAGLIAALVNRLLGELNQERLDLLDQIEAAAGDGPLDLEEILRAFFAPAVYKFVGPDKEFPGLLARLHAEPTPEVVEIIMNVFGPLAQRFLAALKRAVPQLSEQQLLIRALFMKGAILHSLADGDRLAQAFSDGRIRMQDPEVLTSELIGFCAAGFSHSLSEH
jgi:AcrR family transcriptional regulator